MEQAAADAILAKITTGVKDICTDCDLIVEAAIENMEIKNRHSKNYRISVKKMLSLLQIHLHYQSQKLVQDLIVQ